MREILDKLGAELKQLEHEFRVELPKEIKTAVAMGDLRENAEYKAALERQAYVRARIGQLRERLSALASVNLQQIPRDKVGLGSRVTVLDSETGEEKTYVMVFPELGDAANGQLSIASPIGRGLMGRKDGDEVTIVVPTGKKQLEIVELITVHQQGE